MNQEEWKQETHNILSKFLAETADNTDDITASVKCTMVQFIMNTRRALNIVSKINGGYVTPADIIEAQIQELRRCIVDLSQHESFINNHKEGLQ